MPLILSPTTPGRARQRAEEIREGVKLLSGKRGNKDMGTNTLSMGVALFPDQGVEVATLINAADGARYQAKRGGRDQVIMFAEKNAANLLQTPPQPQLLSSNLTGP